MNESNEKKIEYFIALCDDLITCKFLVAESKIQKLLACMAETQPIYELVSDCMEQFNRDREMSKAFVQDAKGRFFFSLPSEEYKLIALVFCTLHDIEEGSIYFTDFVKRFFDDEEGINCYTNFAKKMILPFRNLIAEAFGLPKKETPESKKFDADSEEVSMEQEKMFASKEVEEKVLEFQHSEINGEESLADFELLCNDCQKLAVSMLTELELNEKVHDERINELRCIIYAIVIACAERDFDILHALTIGLRYSAKGIKSIKFLVRQMDESVERFYEIINED